MYLSATGYRSTSDAGSFYTIPSTVSNPSDIAKVLEQYCKALIEVSNASYEIPSTGRDENYLKVSKKARETPDFVYYERYTPFRNEFNLIIDSVIKKQGNLDGIINNRATAAQKVLDSDFNNPQ